MNRIQELSLQGYCCTQVMVQHALDYLDEENEQLMQAAEALCIGVRTDKICGALTGAAIMMTLIDRENALTEMIPELTEWFEDTYIDMYGGINCSDILGERKITRVLKCPDIMEATLAKAAEILQDYNHEFEL